MKPRSLPIRVTEPHFCTSHSFSIQMGDSDSSILDTEITLEQEEGGRGGISFLELVNVRSYSADIAGIAIVSKAQRWSVERWISCHLTNCIW